MLRSSLLAILLVMTAALAAGSMLLAPSPPVASAFTCGPTRSQVETNSKLQIFVEVAPGHERQWAFLITPNPFTLSGSLRVVDNQFTDLNKGSNDILLEDVCTTLSNETYTVAPDPFVEVACPLTPSSITRSAPGPTYSESDPETAAFYFHEACPSPTPTPTLTPTPTSTLTPTPTATPSPTSTPTPVATSIGSTPSNGVSITLDMTPVLVPCNGSAVITALVYEDNQRIGRVVDVVFSSTYGNLAQTTVPTGNGQAVTLLSAPAARQQISGLVAARSQGAQAWVPFTVAACVSQVQDQVFPPVATQPDPPAGSGSSTSLPNNIYYQISLTTPARITPPNTGDGGLR